VERRAQATTMKNATTTAMIEPSTTSSLDFA